MSSTKHSRDQAVDHEPVSQNHTQLLLLPDGRLLAHNLTPAMAEILQKLDPEDELMQQRLSRTTVRTPSVTPP